MLEDLASRALVGDDRLDPAETFDDRVVFLLQPLESPVDGLEMPKDFSKALVVSVEAALDGVEATVHDDDD